jgi:hypothetical protein
MGLLYQLLMGYEYVALVRQWKTELITGNPAEVLHLPLQIPHE